MLWQENKLEENITISSDVVDMAFSIDCRCLPLDHAYNLSSEICKALPWFEQEPLAGLHIIRGGESNHGWKRPEGPDAFLYLSHRTKLTLRLPENQVEKANALSGMTFDIAGYPLHIKTARARTISQNRNLLSHYIITDPKIDEDTFVDSIIIELNKLGVDCHKAICGKADSIRTPTGNLFTRSLMLADLEPQASVIIQQQGLGVGRKIGCGIFIAHKGIG
ncbi:MAG: type I-MYXAN CRISPR-associated protein Cas6/Cmx6 [Candidatus Marithrix sp.]|nr:type I-MYXAN CRISPR-associated protein Cas6/Cmx6 [Candidatus Marithrix sp.]